MAKSSGKEASVGEKILRIGVVLGGKIVEERLIRQRETVTVGQSPKNNTFAIPSPDLPRTWPLFEISGANYLLNFVDGMDGRISINNALLTLQDLKDRGQAKKQNDRWTYPLPETSRGKIVIGDLTLLFQFVKAPPIQPKPQLPHSVRGRFSDRLDPWLSGIMLLSILLHASMYIYLVTLDLPKPPEPDEIPDRFAEALLEAQVEVPQPPVEEVGPGAGKEDEPDKGEGGDGSDKPRNNNTGEATNEDVMSGTANEAAVSQAVQDNRLLKMIAAASQSGAGRFVDVTGGKDPGGDLEKGLANVGKGGGGVAMTGPGGLGGGVRGDGSGEIGSGSATGVSGPRGGGAVGGPKTETAVRVDVTAGSLDEIDSGGLDPSKVMKIIKARYYRGIKQCYERAIKANPKLGGKVTVAFTIGPAGNVTKVAVDGFDAVVDTCIRGQVRGWRFDRPEGSAEFEVPFILRPGN